MKGMFYIGSRLSKIFWIMRHLTVLTQPPRLPHMNMVSPHLITAFPESLDHAFLFLRNGKKDKSIILQALILSNFYIYNKNIRCAWARMYLYMYIHMYMNIYMYTYIYMICLTVSSVKYEITLSYLILNCLRNSLFILLLKNDQY